MRSQARRGIKVGHGEIAPHAVGIRDAHADDIVHHRNQRPGRRGFRRERRRPGRRCLGGCEQHAADRVHRQHPRERRRGTSEDGHQPGHRRTGGRRRLRDNLFGSLLVRRAGGGTLQRHILDYGLSRELDDFAAVA